MIEIRVVGMGQNKITEICARICEKVEVVGHINHLGRFTPSKTYFEFDPNDLRKIVERCELVKRSGSA
jgi:hypothetical protein